MAGAANLPIPLTSLIGREPEIAAVKRLLQRDDLRLLTLTGPGGVGKTRLALAVASDVGRCFADGVRFVGLAPLRDAALVAATLAEALGVRETGDNPIAARLIAFTRDKHLLLVLDNFEHLLPAAPLVTELLAACPRLTVLATSRALLGVSGEHLYPTPPLRLPAPPAGGAAVSPDALLAADAVRLFVARAQAANPDFVLTQHNAAATAAICRRLDGLPLAIELAAARARHVPPPELLTRLAYRLPLLTGGPRDQPVRLQTMRDAIAWSHDLLPPPEQALFRRLAVFVGGCTLAAAEAVGAAGEADTESVLDGLGALLDQSLLRSLASPDGGLRVGMLETIREFALAQLQASGEESAVRGAHAAYFLDLAERADRERPDVSDDFASGSHLGLEQDNLRSALMWLETSGQWTRLLQLATAAAWLWDRLGHFTEGLAWLERALARAKDAAPADRMRALRRVGVMASNTGRFPIADAASAASLDLAREIGDQAGMGWSSIGLGVQAGRQGDHAAYGRWHQQALDCFRAAGNQYGLAHVLSNLGDWAYREQDYLRAGAWSAEALAVAAALPDKRYLTGALNDLGQLALERRDAAESTRRYVESAQTSLTIGDAMGVAQALSGLAGVAVLRRQPERAARWLAAARAYLEEIGATTIGNEEQYARALAATRAALTPTQFDAAWASGRILSIRDATAEAIAEMTPTESVASGRAPSIPAPNHSLTRREREVLHLLALGRT
ncbi:MAG TPA: NB-ARC domain-containing protein, partial [Thermomicrobiales bacterium]|nr:NB-ARC domain-containing protein [Thermomicrobiales bacterium]